VFLTLDGLKHDYTALDGEEVVERVVRPKEGPVALKSDAEHSRGSITSG
jgi:hypothetical protein